MTKLDILIGILDDKFVCPNQTILQEKNFGKTPVICGKRTNYKLYKFDVKNVEIFPYFKQVSGLKKMCDYLLFAEREDELYVFVIELKKTNSAGSQKQLEASEVFANFIIESAKRIGNNLEKTYIRKICICDKKQKGTTREEPIDYDNNRFVKYKHQILRLDLLMHY